jgi:hypothetical protein
MPSQRGRSRAKRCSQGSNLDAVIEAVCAAGGEITHQRGIINAVGARMTRIQLRELKASDDTLRIGVDRTATVDSRPPVAVNGHTPNEPATEGPCPPTDADTANDLTPAPSP